MARPQSGIIPAPLLYNRIQVYELPDLPMTSMTVGQFSVMIPGLGHQLAQTYASEELRVTVGFGFMFWTLAWHGQTPSHFQTFDALESGNREIAEGEGDLWVHYTSTNVELITKLIHKVDDNLKGLVSLTEDHQLMWEKPPTMDQAFPENIWVPNEEVEFSRGTFLLQIEIEHSPLYKKSLVPSLHALLEKNGLSDQVLLRDLEFDEEAKKGSLIQLFHRNSGKLDSLMEDWLDEDQPHLAWGGEGVGSATATRFFVPSLDVLTGLRQGGIRMNRFSQTRQWKD